MRCAVGRTGRICARPPEKRSRRPNGGGRAPMGASGAHCRVRCGTRGSCPGCLTVGARNPRSEAQRVRREVMARHSRTASTVPEQHVRDDGADMNFIFLSVHLLLPPFMGYCMPVYRRAHGAGADSRDAAKDIGVSRVRSLAGT